MLAHPNDGYPILTKLFCLVAIIVFFTSCTNEALPLVPTVAITPVQSELPEYPKAEITFEAKIPAALTADQNLSIEFLDEVTGLAFNAAQVIMEKQDENTYILKMPIIVGSVIKYRYIRDKDPFAIEYSTLGEQVRYRLYYVDGPGIVKDTISAWKTLPFIGSAGRIQGQVSLINSNSPVVSAYVTAGGIHTFTASDGTFILEGLPEGNHNLVVYDLNGLFRPFQQGAIVSPESTTPATIQVVPNETVNVTFLVSPPENSINGVPIRIVGNLYSLGNTFADLDGGVSVVSSRSPLLAVLPDGRYSITLNLPKGLDLRYKYTLGDGFWNSERTNNGEVRLRQLIIPDKDTTIQDVIDSWGNSGQNSISFTVTVPQSTPVRDSISIQFNPFAWTEPIPMWPAGNNRWFYILYNPINVLNGGSYRFCRNEQCGTADTIDTQGPSASGLPFLSFDQEQIYNSPVKSWAWLDKKTEQIVVPAGEISVRDDNFVTGVEFSSNYHPSWQPYTNSAIQNIRDIGANTVILAPTWYLSHQNPPVIEPVSGRDALWPDLIQMVNQAQQKGLWVAIHPIIRYPEESSDWWSNAARDGGWWQSWFDRYRTFLLHHADLAAQTGVKTLIIGDATLIPALPGGTLSDGSSSLIPDNAANQWQKLISELRARYKGKLAWFVSCSGDMPGIPDFASDLDAIYIELSAPFTESDQLSQIDLEAKIANLFDTKILKTLENSSQSIVIGLRYPSIQGMLDGCVESGEECLPNSSFNNPAIQYPNATLDLKAQADLYTAVLNVINQRPWITGFYSAGYYPPVSLLDYSVSIHGKPASDVLWYWYPRLTGTASQ